MEGIEALSDAEFNQRLDEILGLDENAACNGRCTSRHRYQGGRTKNKGVNMAIRLLRLMVLVAIVTTAVLFGQAKTESQSQTDQDKQFWQQQVMNDAKKMQEEKEHPKSAAQFSQEILRDAEKRNPQRKCEDIAACEAYLKASSCLGCPQVFLVLIWF